MKLKRKVLAKAEPINAKIDDFYKVHYETIKHKDANIAKRFSDTIFLCKKNAQRVIYIQELIRNGENSKQKYNSKEDFDRSVNENIKTGIRNIQETINDYVSANIPFLVFEPIELL